MKSVLTACTLALLLVAAPARASAFKQADQYFEVRDRAQLVETYTLQEVQTDAQRFAGKLLEIRGAVTGVFESSTGGSLIVQPTNGASLTLVLPLGKLTEWPFLDVGNSVRMLCKVVPSGEGSASGTLEIVIPVKEYEASRLDEGRAKVAAAKKAEAERKIVAVQRRSAKPNPKLASRGVGSTAYTQAETRYSQGQLISIYGDAVRYFNRRLSVGESRQIAGLILNYSNRYGLDARLVMAVIACESNFNANAVSPVGAMGLGQLMPGTASDLGVGNAWDPSANLEGSTRLLKSHIKNMSRGGRPSKEAIKLALACYNAGAGAVKKYKGIPPYRETQNYVKKIIRLYWSMLPPSERDWTPD